MLTISLPNSVSVIKRPVLITVASTTVTCFSLSACGGSITGNNAGRSSGSYAVTVQEVIGSLSHTVGLNLTASQP